MSRLLAVDNLKTHFYTTEGIVPSVDGVDFVINEGETVALVGESGSGKSVTALSIMRLIPSPGKIVSGSINYQDQDLVKLSNAHMRTIRGNKISMISQDPMTGLNPAYTIGDQISETIRLHMKKNRKDAKEYCIKLLKDVGIPHAEENFSAYPHQLSGGMRQRIMIAMAIACEPNLLIADEPTTALDVTIQAQILELIKKLKKENNTSIIMITHDLGVVSEVCDKVMVMYAGRIVEEADVTSLFESPKHPYTKALINTLPSLDKEVEWLETIPGNVPIPSEMPKGCKYAPRCPYVMEKCLEKEPELSKLDNQRKARCFLVEGDNRDTAFA